ncbi:CDP-alcohol phosphatidyltransferase family protein [Flavobacterium sp.]|uniref:CDP-alcohol phosphatidyltransferase family protein n=1 Tax=Flavobacterium sp. TaxID=239 RepID=UPI0038FCD997
MNIPKLLILIRFCFAPIILLITYLYGEKASSYILILMYVGLLTDIFDGIIARKQNISDEKLRRLDSQTDMIFWLSIGISTWLLRNEILRENLIGVWTILFMEILCYIISFAKFKKETCTHAILSKLWGITLLVAFTALIGFNNAGIYYYTCVIVGFIAHLDVILIILLLPKWTHDVPSSYHALKIRKGEEIKRNKLFNA